MEIDWGKLERYLSGNEIPRYSKNQDLHLTLTMLSSPVLRLSAENALFSAIALIFIVTVAWAWRETKPYTLPEPLPGWFAVWFGSVQILGGLVPLGALGWSIWQGYPSATAVWLFYYLMLGLQILLESLTLRQYATVVWVMVPYLFLPYRIWQLYEGMNLLEPLAELDWMRSLLWLEIGVWSLNYLLDVAQLPRLYGWLGTQENPD
ncbi:hypothetical protein [Desertifilum tharense]|nr:hypothetical protein [Desertifilum tharense]